MDARIDPYRTSALSKPRPVPWIVRSAARWAEIVYGFWLLWPVLLGIVVLFYCAFFVSNAATTQMILGIGVLVLLPLQFIWFIVDGMRGMTLDGTCVGPERPLWYWHLLLRAGHIRAPTS